MASTVAIWSRSLTICGNNRRPSASVKTISSSPLDQRVFFVKSSFHLNFYYFSFSTSSTSSNSARSGFSSSILPKTSSSEDLCIERSSTSSFLASFVLKRRDIFFDFVAILTIRFKQIHWFLIPWWHLSRKASQGAFFPSSFPRFRLFTLQPGFWFKTFTTKPFTVRIWCPSVFMFFSFLKNTCWADFSNGKGFILEPPWAGFLEKFLPLSRLLFRDFPQRVLPIFHQLFQFISKLELADDRVFHLFPFLHHVFVFSHCENFRIMLHEFLPQILTWGK